MLGAACIHSPHLSDLSHPQPHRSPNLLHLWSCTPCPPPTRPPAKPRAEMRLCGQDVWGHFAPLFHLVDVFAVYAVTLVGGRHVVAPPFSPHGALLTIGAWPGAGRAAGSAVLRRCTRRA